MNIGLYRVMDNMVKKLLEKINNGNYRPAMDIFVNNFYDINDEYEIEIFDNNNLHTFEFMEYVGNNTNIEKIVSFVSIIFSTALCHYDNGYIRAYEYAKKLVELNPNNIENWEWILFFYEIPEKLIDKIELKNTIKKILKMDINNKVALKVMGEFAEKEKEEIINNIKK